MGDGVFWAALAIVLSILVLLLFKNVFNLWVRDDAKLLQRIPHRCGARVKAPVALALPFSSPPSVSLKKECDSDKSSKEIQPPKKHKVYIKFHWFPTMFSKARD